jgi:hypothetical protein
MNTWHTIACKDFDAIDWIEFAKLRNTSQVHAARFLHVAYKIGLRDVLMISAMYSSQDNTLSTTSIETFNKIQEALFKVQFDANRVPEEEVQRWYKTYLHSARIQGFGGIFEFLTANNIPYQWKDTEEYGNAISDDDSIRLFHDMIPNVAEQDIFVIVDWCYKDKLFYKMKLSDFDNFILYNGHFVVLNGDCIVLFESGKIFGYFHEDAILYADMSQFTLGSISPRKF